MSLTPQGFVAVHVKYSASSSAQHVLFIKQHSVRERSTRKPSDRTLFVVNVPPYCTKTLLENAWKVCGNVTTVFLHSRPMSNDPPAFQSEYFPTEECVKGFKVAYVVFEKASELRRALKWSINQPLILSSPEEPQASGMQKWCEDYNNSIPNNVELQKDIDLFMEVYDKNVQAEIAKAEEEERDGEGWTTVTQRGRNPGFARSEKVLKSLKVKEDKKRSKKQLLNFYSFQVRESKMKNLIKLRQKFEEDKKKIQTLKQMRKFKPF